MKCHEGSSSGLRKCSATTRTTNAARVLRSAPPENSHLAVQKYPPGRYASASCRLHYSCTLWGGGVTPSSAPTAGCSDIGPQRPRAQGYLRVSSERLFYAFMRGGSTSLQSAVSDFLMEELYSFIGEGWEQEDDITLLTLRRSAPLS